MALALAESNPEASPEAKPDAVADADAGADSDANNPAAPPVKRTGHKAKYYRTLMLQSKYEKG